MNTTFDNRINRVSQQKRFTSLILPFFFLVAIFTTYQVRHHVFFWDTIQLGSKHAHFYYENNFEKLLLPADIDSGHPPTFGLYLAIVWKFFGKTLPVSHFAMLPFLFGIVFFLWKIGKNIITPPRVLTLFLLTIVDPTLASQCVLISPDVALICFFLMGVYAILQRQPVLKMFAMLGLAMISMRGMMSVAALFLFELMLYFDNWKKLPSQLLTIIPFYLPAGLFGFAFLIWHYQQAGWIGYHADSPWASSFQKADTKGLLKNVLILGWRMLDFGRIFIWLSILFFLWQKKSLRLLTQKEKTRPFFILLLSCIIVLTPTMVLYQGLSAHRYLLPVYLSLTLLVTTLFATLSVRSYAFFFLFLICFLGLASGNLWRYPDKVAQGWDATLGHLPYYQIRTEMLERIKNQGIPLDSIGTAFPEIGPQKFRDLSSRIEGMVEKDFNNQNYILYSNVMNDFTDKEIDTLNRNWIPLHRSTQCGVTMILFARTNIK